MKTVTILNGLETSYIKYLFFFFSQVGPLTSLASHRAERTLVRLAVLHPRVRSTLRQLKRQFQEPIVASVVVSWVDCLCSCQLAVIVSRVTRHTRCELSHGLLSSDCCVMRLQLVLPPFLFPSSYFRTLQSCCQRIRMDKKASRFSRPTDIHQVTKTSKLQHY